MSPWHRVSLTSLVQSVASWNPGIEGRDKLVEYIDISSIDREQRQITNTTRMPGQDAPSRARQLVKKDDLLVSTVRPNLNAVAQVPKELDGATASTGFCVLRVKDELLVPRYLYYWLRTNEFIDSMMLQATGASYPAVTDRIVKSSQIPLPPLSEQRRLAAILDAADGLRAKRRAALGKLDALGRAVFWEMFGEPTKNPKGWKTIPLGNIAEFIGGGTPSREVDEYYEGSICWATSKDMKGEFLYDTQEHITQKAIERSATNLVPVGTILVCVKSKILLKRLPVMIACVPTCFGQDLKGIKLPNHLPAVYVATHLRMGQRALLQLARGVNTEGLTLEHLRRYRLMMPPISIVQRYADFEARHRSMRDELERSLISYQELFTSLQQRAFCGEL